MFDWYFVTYHFVVETLLLTCYFTCLSFVRRILFPAAKLVPISSIRLPTSDMDATFTLADCRNDCRAVYFPISDLGGLTSTFMCAIIIICASFFLHLPSMWERRVQLSHPTLSLNHSWYAQLVKPWWTPSPIVFASVGIIVKILQSYALALVFECCHQRSFSIPIFLVLSYVVVADLFHQVFFVQHDLVGGLVIILVLICFAVVIFLVFIRIALVAAYLLVPLFLWLIVACSVTVSIVWMNRTNQRIHWE